MFFFYDQKMYEEIIVIQREEEPKAIVAWSFIIICQVKPLNQNSWNMLRFNHRLNVYWQLLQLHAKQSLLALPLAVVNIAGSNC